MANTIFEGSTTPLKYWFHAIYIMSSTRCGISAKQLQREIGVTYKTAWRMFNKIRDMLYQPPVKKKGTFEADETYLGARRPGKVGRGAKNKSIIFGIVNRNGRLICKKITNVKANTLIPLIEENVTPEAIIYTDEFPSYKKLSELGYTHEFIHHLNKIYVINDVHINSIEGFWSLFKRGINGVYHSVSKKHLQKYINEYVFRYNNRNNNNFMFYKMMAVACRTF
jgi:transposase-like protein